MKRKIKITDDPHAKRNRIYVRVSNEELHAITLKMAACGYTKLSSYVREALLGFERRKK